MSILGAVLNPIQPSGQQSSMTSQTVQQAPSGAPQSAASGAGETPSSGAPRPSAVLPPAAQSGETPETADGSAGAAAQRGEEDGAAERARQRAADGYESLRAPGEPGRRAVAAYIEDQVRKQAGILENTLSQAKSLDLSQKMALQRLLMTMKARPDFAPFFSQVQSGSLAREAAAAAAEVEAAKVSERASGF
jgi:hypothetical protein